MHAAKALLSKRQGDGQNSQYSGVGHGGLGPSLRGAWRRRLKEGKRRIEPGYSRKVSLSHFKLGVGFPSHLTPY
jgi:hypothetical protein